MQNKKIKRIETEKRLSLHFNLNSFSIQILRIMFNGYKYSVWAKSMMHVDDNYERKK
jgi:hypothetical protein